VRRAVVALFLASIGLHAQTLSFGLKGGVPVTNAFKITGPSSYISDGGAYTAGPMLEVNLPFRLSVEGDALYRPVEYRSSGLGGSLLDYSGQSWEFPVLLKYRLTSRRLRPYLGAGLAFRRLRGFDEGVAELRERSAAGAVLGAGMELRMPVIRLSGEIRYTRWGSTSFKSALGDFRSQLNQAEFLVGIAF